jgi:hypothetical protein
MCRSQTGIPSTCELRRQNVVRIPDDDRFWLVTPSSATVDYIFTSPTRSRKKAGPAIWHAPMILPLASDSSSNSNANIEPNLPPSDSNDDITAMLLDTLESPPGPHRQRPPRSSSPAPVWCEGCDVQAPDGDDDPQEVECEVCKFWSHIACLTREQEDLPQSQLRLQMLPS